jgi:hypothetical protein
MNFIIRVTLLAISFEITTARSFEVFVPKLLERPIITLRKLYPDPSQCVQMTWDALWKKDNPSSCRGLSCLSPYYDGFEPPEPSTLNRTCTLLKGQSCIKVVIYDKYDKTRPEFISRSCGYVPDRDTGERLSNRCLRVFDGAQDIEVCACRDSNTCNSANQNHNKAPFIFMLFIIALICFLC